MKEPQQVQAHRPQSWDLRVHFPDHRQIGSETTAHWDLTLDEPIEVDGQSFSLVGPCHVDVKLRRESREVHAFLTLSAEVLTQCSRCLCELPVAIQQDFMYSYMTCQGALENDPEEKYADPVIDIQVSRLTGPVELGDLVWECFFVSLPRYASCEGGCETPIHWENDQSDLRLGVFAELLKKDKGGNQDGDA